MGKFQFMAKLYGVRGSYPIAPENGTKIGGNTPCLLVRSQKHIVIFDAGSGVIKLGKDLIGEINEHGKKSVDPLHITFIFTHTHSDHLIGLPFFAPLYMPNVFIHFIGPATLGVDFEQILRRLVEPQYFPVSMDEFRSNKSFRNINENMTIYFLPGVDEPQIAHANETVPDNAEFAVHNMKYYFHPKDGNYVYRVNWKNKALVYATDVEEYSGGDQRLITFSKDADFLIHDAQYTEEQYKSFNGYGHSSFVMACDAAKQANVKKLLLFHHDPNNDDDVLYEIEKDARKLFTNSELATEKWEWIL
ncbi:MAG: MBL fold metallo-hydrolase [Calditrichaceae bacterium]